MDTDDAATISDKKTSRLRRRRCKRPLPETASDTEENGSEKDAEPDLEEDMDTVMRIAAKSGNLKGTFQRALKEVAARTKRRFAELHSRVADAPTLRRYESTVTDLRAEISQLREELRKAKEKEQRQPPPPPPPPLPKAPQGDPTLKEILRRMERMEASIAEIRQRPKTPPEQENQQRNEAESSKPTAVDSQKRTRAARQAQPTQPPSAPKPKELKKSPQAGPSGTTPAQKTTPLTTPSGGPSGILPSPNSETGPESFAEVVRKKKRTPTSQGPATPVRKPPPAKKTEKNLPKGPKTAAVTMTIQEGSDCTLEEAMRLAKQKISLRELGIAQVRPRRAAVSYTHLTLPTNREV